MPLRRRAPITVVIPAYQREDMIAQTVRSVQEQSLPVREIIVVDDGSTDRTAKVAESLGVRVLRQENGGVSAARNTGILAASEDWVALLDSDDLWEPEKIEVQWRALCLHPDAGLIFTDWLHFDESGVVESGVLTGRQVYDRLPRRRIAADVVLCERRGLGTALLGGNFIKPSTILAKRELMLGAGLFDTEFGRADSLVGQVEDRDFFLRLAALTDALVVECPLVRYRLHSGGASQDRLRMVMGAAKVAERVFAEPERYPEGAVQYYRLDYPERLREAGILLMDSGRFPEARRVLWRSLRERPLIRTIAAFGASLLGKVIYERLVHVKRRFQLPGLRRRFVRTPS